MLNIKLRKNISGYFVVDNSNNEYVFPALATSNSCSTIDYDTHINIKIDYTINRVFRSMRVQELNTPLTVCKFERNEPDTNSVQNKNCWIPSNRKS